MRIILSALFILLNIVPFSYAADLDSYISILKSGSKEERIEAVKKLAESRDKGIIKVLIGSLNDKEKIVQAHAIIAITDFKEAAVLPLIDAIKNEDEIIRGNAANILGNIQDQRAVEPLTRLLKDKENFVKNNALNALGRIPVNETAVSAINGMLLTETDSGVRRTAIIILRVFKDKSSVEVLIKMLKDENILVREDAVFNLSDYRDIELVKPLLLAMNDNPDRVNELIVKGFLRLGKSELLIILKDALDDPFLKRSVIYTLGRLGDSEGVDILIKLLDDSDEDIKKAVILSLSNSKDKTAAIPVAKFLKSGNVEIRLLAAKALAKLGDKDAVPKLADSIYDVNREVQFSVIDSLTDIGGEEALKELKLFYQKSPDPDISRKIEEAISKLEKK